LSETRGSNDANRSFSNLLDDLSQVASAKIAGGNNSPRCREPVGVTSNPIYGTAPLRKDSPPVKPRPKTVVGPFPGSSFE
jgi:hypothetical protein